MEINQLNILAVGRNTEIMQVVHRLLNAHEKWTGAVASTPAEAIDAFSTQHYEIVLLCAGLSPEEASQFKARLAQLSPTTILIQHFGGGSGLLENEILAALSRHNIRLS